MGVTGLWKLIEPCGKPVPVETLEGKVLAVDISIWLHQVVKGFQDNKGAALSNAHLLGLFHRLCKLLYYRVRPVFVFDGCVPQLKRDTIARRQQQRSKLNVEADRIEALLLQSLAKEKVVQQALGVNAELLLKSPGKRLNKRARADDDNDDIFKLPELPVPTGKSDVASSLNDEENILNKSSDTGGYSTDEYDTGGSTSLSATDDSSFDDANPRNAYNTNLQAIDVRSQHFRQLPADVRHEILIDIKETRKQSSWGRLHELPSRGDDFSTFQMHRLMKRRAVQQSLEEAQEEMGGHTLTYAELKNLFTEEGIVEPTAMEQGTKQIISDENTRFLLVRDLKKKLSKVEETPEEVIDAPKQELEEEKPSTSKQTVATEQPKCEITDAALGADYDADLDLAIALSLEESNVYSEHDYVYDGGESLRLNREQRDRLQNAAKGPARAYMIEYGGMNEDEVAGIMEKTQVAGSDFDDLTAEIRNIVGDEPAIEIKDSMSSGIGEEDVIKLVVTDDEIDVEQLPVATVIAKKDSELEVESEELRLRVTDTSDTDSDLEEVTTVEKEASTATEKNELEIVFNLKQQFTRQDDLFADIFEADLKEEDNKDNEALKKVEQNTEKLQKDTAEQMREPPVVIAPKKADNLLAILDELKKQVADVENIKLENITLKSTAVCEISDDDECPSSIAQLKSEVIEICDSDDNQRRSPVHVTPSKSPKQQTPSKTKAISEYFNMDYVIKRTPEKVSEQAEELVPKVKSPFFVNKTPRSSRKRAATDQDSPLLDTSPSRAKRLSKASKTLFEEEGGDDAAIVPVDNGMESLPTSSTPAPRDLLAEAAEALKQQKSADELQTLAKDLARERGNLESERNRQDRMGMSISQRMSADCQDLLRLFGIPYIVAPMEAEAQCAFLDAAALTNGTITDDSDIWLFGGRTVYKNFFAQHKHVLEFRADKIEQLFSCDRQKLIQLACLVGSDYTTGIHGIGAVTALEILASFSAAKDTASSSSSLVSAQDSNNASVSIPTILATLSRFRDWWVACKSSAMPPGSSVRLALRKKLKNIELHDGFPSSAVIEAYLLPKVDECRDAFSWGHPDGESIREFTRKTFGWTTSKTDDILRPVLKRLEEKRTQATIRNYFNVKSAVSVRDLKVSKRVQKAIDKMAGNADDETPEKVTKPRAKRATRSGKHKADATGDAAPANEADNDQMGVSAKKQKRQVEKKNTVSNGEEDTSSLAANTSSRTKRISRTTSVVAATASASDEIPQRAKTMDQMRRNKERAAAILKKSAKTVAQDKKRKS